MANAVVGKFETLVAANSAEVRNANRFPTQTDERQLKLSSVVETRKRILFVTPEITDFVKAGGLGEVSAALPRALSSKHDVRVLIPGYRPVMDAIRDEMQIVGRIPALAAMPACDIARVDQEDGLVIYVLVCPELYERPGTPYADTHGADWVDNHIRFGRLASAAADLAAGTASIRWCPDLLHLNDWQTGLAAGYVQWRGLKTPSVMTIHNLAYQGVFPRYCMADLGIPAEAFSIDGLEYYGKISFLKAGLSYASHITTVSQTYAKEITTPEFGCGLEGLLQVKTRQGKLSGILNGIDEGWDPCNDPHLCQSFSPYDWAGKQANAERIRKDFGLEVSEGPLFAVVSRLVHQKGIDLTIEAVDHIISRGGQLVIIGCGEPAVERAVNELSKRYKGRVGVHVGFCETEARRMFAGSDFLLMPSRFEPCGLSQMYAQRFASLPIARRTGGLADSIEDGVTGFLFDKHTLESYTKSIDRAFEVFERKDLLQAMRRRAMNGPFYWSQSAQPYDELYQSLLSKVRQEQAAI
ncbi:glycogen synthase GlgA [Pseudomonas luteola]|uniref:Glycogen synthase n=1 Tax=Pseudomonas luteola TaxID=47886 RepID=A0ABS0MN95_PSELU|nr:glycogen synthase GlgA [Pseudomonas luteola]MBH3437523.1 glycogen synthase GlgA [Pseudomonas luteola]